jgi:hypothetical protein
VLLCVVAVSACNAPPRTREETRMFPKAPLEQMGPVIRPEPTTAMSRLAHLNKPQVVEIPAESVVAPKK